MKSIHITAVIVTAIVLAYARVCAGEFQFDDYNVIVDNPAVHSWRGWTLDLAQGIRPVLKASYTANWIMGPGPAGFHATNIFIHALNGMLVLALAFRLLRAQPGMSTAIAWRAAALASLLFALHPVQTEAVSYISGRSSSLMALFYLAALLSYDQGVAHQRRLWLFVISPLFFCLAIATKESAVTLPVALVLWDAATTQGRLNARAMLKRQAVHWAVLAAAAALMYMHARYHDLLVYASGFRSMGDNLLTQLDALAYLLSRYVMPRLNIDPDLPVHGAWNPVLMLEGALLVACVVVAFASMRRRAWVGFGLLWLLLHLLPTNSVVPRLDVANERHLYLAGIGLFLIAGVVLARTWALSGTGRNVAVFLTGVLMLLLGGTTLARNADYLTEVALWESTALRSPLKARVWNNLGYAYYLAGRNEDARNAFRTALRLDPAFVLAANNLGLLPARPGGDISR